MMNINKYAAEAVRYRKEICAILNSQDPEDLEKGLLVIKDSLISNDFKPLLLANSKGLLSDYDVKFDGGFIQLQASLNARQLGPVDVTYRLKVQEFRFDNTGHKLYATFEETANPLGNMAQKLALKAALMKGPLLKTALQITAVPFMHVDGNHILLDFDQMRFTERLPASLRMEYLSSRNSRLTLSFKL